MSVTFNALIFLRFTILLLFLFSYINSHGRYISIQYITVEVGRKQQDNFKIMIEKVKKNDNKILKA